MVKIVQKEEPVLRETAKEVPIEEIKSKKIQKIIKDMKEALASQKDGVAIAAPQIGESLRIFVVLGLIFLKPEETENQEKVKLAEDKVFINPIIIKTSKDKKTMEEGCLSVRWLYGKVKRASRITLRAYDENGEFLERGASGLLAQIFQHETDHLNGILFTDQAKELIDMPPPDKKNG
ncbi:MAG: peptide deformylase [Candidatus Paceibacterota bacterium]